MTYFSSGDPRSDEAQIIYHVHAILILTDILSTTKAYITTSLDDLPKTVNFAKDSLVCGNKFSQGPWKEIKSGVGRFANFAYFIFFPVYGKR